MLYSADDPPVYAKKIYHNFMFILKVKRMRYYLVLFHHFTFFTDAQKSKSHGAFFEKQHIFQQKYTDSGSNLQKYIILKIF